MTIIGIIAGFALVAYAAFEIGHYLGRQKPPRTSQFYTGWQQGWEDAISGAAPFLPDTEPYTEEDTST